MKIEQKAGPFVLTAYTDGWPITTTVASHGVERLTLGELKDLHYATGRMVEKIEAEIREIERRHYL